jgi:hypothetical protein
MLSFLPPIVDFEEEGNISLHGTERHPEAKNRTKTAIYVFVPTLPIPRLSKAGMPSRSEGWGGLFKDESTD